MGWLDIREKRRAPVCLSQPPTNRDCFLVCKLPRDAWLACRPGAGSPQPPRLVAATWSRRRPVSHGFTRARCIPADV